MSDAAAQTHDLLTTQPQADPERGARRPAASRDDPNRHTLLYAGEWQNGSFDRQRMFLLDKGRVAWSYEMPWAGEYGQVSVLPNGNILFARYHGATEITPDGDVVWNYDAPDGTEMHTCRPIGDDRVFIVVNGHPARAAVLRKTDNVVEHELILPTNDGSPHSMFRSCDFTPEGTYLVGHMDMDKVAEYAPSGDVVWQVEVPSPWGVSRLADGHTLVSGDHAGYVREYDEKGSQVWGFDRDDADALGITLYSVQQSTRLPNGNTLFANWCSSREDQEERHASVQLLEVTPAKQIAWMLSQWTEPNLGPASFFHVLDSNR